MSHLTDRERELIHVAVTAAIEDFKIRVREDLIGRIRTMPVTVSQEIEDLREIDSLKTQNKKLAEVLGRVKQEYADLIFTAGEMSKAIEDILQSTVSIPIYLITQTNKALERWEKIAFPNGKPTV